MASLKIAIFSRLLSTVIHKNEKGLANYIFLYAQSVQTR